MPGAAVSPDEAGLDGHGIRRRRSTIGAAPSSISALIPARRRELARRAQEDEEALAPLEVEVQALRQLQQPGRG